MGMARNPMARAIIGVSDHSKAPGGYGKMKLKDRLEMQRASLIRKIKKIERALNPPNRSC